MAAPVSQDAALAFEIKDLVALPEKHPKYQERNKLLGDNPAANFLSTMPIYEARTKRLIGRVIHRDKDTIVLRWSKMEMPNASIRCGPTLPTLYAVVGKPKYDNQKKLKPNEFLLLSLYYEGGFEEDVKDGRMPPCPFQDTIRRGMGYTITACHQAMPFCSQDEHKFAKWGVDLFNLWTVSPEISKQRGWFVRCTRLSLEDCAICLEHPAASAAPSSRLVWNCCSNFNICDGCAVKVDKCPNCHAPKNLFTRRIVTN
jgi:hypothetical protein